MKFQRNTCCLCVHFKDLHASTESINNRLLHIKKAIRKMFLQRVVLTIKLLSRLGLAFRSHEEDGSKEQLQLYEISNA